DNLARAFLELGIQHGDRIGVISTTRPEYLCVYLAAARIGAIMVGFNILYTPSELIRLANITTPKVMVVLDKTKDRTIAEPLKPVFDTMAFIEAYVVIGNNVPKGAYSLNQLLHT